MMNDYMPKTVEERINQILDRYVKKSDREKAKLELECLADDSFHYGRVDACKSAYD